MSNFFNVIKNLVPDGEAYWLFKDKQHTQMMSGLAEEPARIETFFDDVLQSGIPDGNIQEAALNDWETFLAISTNDSLSVIERNERITGKYTAQGGQGPDYMEDTMQAAGFPIYVYENTFPFIDPHVLITAGATLIPGPPTYGASRINDFTLGGHTLGSKTLGAYLGTSISTIYKDLPVDASVYGLVWFLSGPNVYTDIVNIPLIRKEDFIKQLLQIKPARTWVVANINWT